MSEAQPSREAMERAEKFLDPDTHLSQVLVVAAALDAAELRGWNRAVEACAERLRGIPLMDPEHPCADTYEGAMDDAEANVRALKRPQGGGNG